jgi:4,5-DOPA dioxygenase extradiol
MSATTLSGPEFSGPEPSRQPLRVAGPVGRMPALFVSHGMPSIVVDPDEPLRAVLARFAAALPPPRAAVVLSAHWVTEEPLRVTAGIAPPTLHDFDEGFFPELSDIAYFCPGSPEVAGEVVDCLAAAAIAAQPQGKRGLDHGAWGPMLLAYPQARVPVVQLSLPRSGEPERLRRVGRALAPLRDRGVLLVGSGGVVHNLERVRFDDRDAGPEVWAEAFDAWVAERLSEGDLDGLLEYRENGPFADLAHPTSEHFDPLLAIAATAGDEDVCAPLYAGIRHGSLSMRAFAVTSLAVTLPG